MKVAFGCDHGGFIYKEAVLNYLKSKSIEYVDFGTFSDASVDYPDFADKVCKCLQNKECEQGILICGTGIGMSMCANKYKGIRCAHVTDEFSAEMTKRHNNANVIALGARISSVENVIKYIDIFLHAGFDGGRHEARVEKINKLD